MLTLLGNTSYTEQKYLRVRSAMDAGYNVQLTWCVVEFEVKTAICLTEINRRTQVELITLGNHVITDDTTVQLQLSVAG